ncbi:hypothetical protein C0585_08145 [Candidatus Woesearchaeota archaeon]|nr:MAG: hypothetical protein C0585_08145 [Candidatus Woesearchaeota archaeon]
MGYIQTDDGIIKIPLVFVSENPDIDSVQTDILSRFLHIAISHGHNSIDDLLVGTNNEKEIITILEDAQKLYLLYSDYAKNHKICHKLDEAKLKSLHMGARNGGFKMVDTKLLELSEFAEDIENYYFLKGVNVIKPNKYPLDLTRTVYTLFTGIGLDIYPDHFRRINFNTAVI